MMSLGISMPACGGVEHSGQVTIGTDYLFRGISQTMSAPSVQAEVYVEHDSGWYGWAWGSNVDFVPAGAAPDGAELEIDIAVGYAIELGDALLLSLESVAYLFPGTRAGYEYDYTEWLLCARVQDRHRLTAGYSDDVFGTDRPGRYIAAGSMIDLTERIGIDMEVGHYDLQHALGVSYAFAATTLVYTADLLEWRLSYYTSSNEANIVVDPTTASDRLVLAVSMPF